MKKQDFLDKLRDYDSESETEYVKFSYLYPIRQTDKSVLLVINKTTKAKFIPLRYLKLNRGEGHVYIEKWLYRRLLQGV